MKVAAPHPDISTLRESLRRDRGLLEQHFLAQGKAARLLSAHSKLIDQYLRMIWQQLAMPPTLTLIAVGGYGRGELYPKSDIDLLILLDQEPDEALQQQLHELIALLWDIGLEVGHSIRTIAQCLVESADITVQTNLLEARILCGNALLFDSLCNKVQQHLDPLAFFTAKLHEQKLRHARFDDTDFNLEPNLKESPGGLRDLQTVTWISRAAGLGTRWPELAEAGLISKSEARQIARHDALLQTLRTRLHYLARRREDRLLFDFQTTLASQMGIEASLNRRASEHLMQRYYRTRLAVRQFNTILLQNLRDRIFRDMPPQHALNERFRVIGTLLDIRDEQLEKWPRTPEAIRRHLAEYYAMITHADANMGRVLDVLRAKGQLDNTVIVFSGDNGLALGQHGLMGKQSVYEHSVRVPLILAGPGVPAGQDREAPVYLSDLFSTLAEMAGVPVPASVEGHSLVPCLSDPLHRVHEALYLAYADSIRGVRKDDWKLIEYAAGDTQLFDLANDPYEQHSVADRPDQQTRVAALRREMIRLRDAGNDRSHPTGAAFWKRRSF